jgi:hypothetical protein
MFRRRFKLSKTNKEFNSNNKEFKYKDNKLKQKVKQNKKDNINSKSKYLNPKTLLTISKVIPLYNNFDYKYKTIDIGTKIFLESLLTKYGDRAFIFKYENSKGNIKEFDVNILNPIPFSEELWETGDSFYVIKYKNKLLLPPEQYSNIKTIWNESQYTKLENEFLFNISSNTNFTEDNISDFYEYYNNFENIKSKTYRPIETIIDIDDIMETDIEKYIENNILDVTEQKELFEKNNEEINEEIVEDINDEINTEKEQEQRVIIRTLYTEHKTRKNIYKHNRIYFYNKGQIEPFFMLSFCNKKIKK